MKKIEISVTGILLSLLSPALLTFAGNKQNETTSQKKNPRPNILFIVSEDNGMEIGCYGTKVYTPNIDKIAQSGTRFANSYVTQAGSSPCRASFFTGLYPHQNGQIGLATWDYSMYDSKTPNFVNDLKKNGYKTGIIGKIHVNPESAFPFDWHEIDGGNFQRKNLGKYAPAASKFMTSSDEPFFLQVNYPDAHDPFLPQIDGRPKKILTKDDVETLPFFGVTSDLLKQQTANYLNCIMRLDELVGDLMEELKKSGKYENTLVVYIGDHGVDMLRGKRTVYEGGLRIPMIMSWPALGKSNIVYDGLVSVIDIYPTFMAASGIKIPKHLPGKSLLPAISGDVKPVRDYLFAEFHVHSNHNPYPQRSVRDANFKLIYNSVAGHTNPGYNFTIGKKIEPIDFNKALKKASLDVQQAYKIMQNPPEFELYDMKNDPYEWKNLASLPEYASTLNKYKKVLVKWQKETKDPFIDKKIAEKLFLEIMNAKEKRIEIKYHEYLKPVR